MSGTNVTQRWTVRLSAFEELTAKWKQVQLPSLQHQDERDVIVQSRERLAQSRKEVSARTKDFAKYTAEEKTANLGSLVKLYQGHVDEVTQSLKRTETLYMDLIERIRSMTDPYPMMEKFSREKQTILDFIAAAQEADTLRNVVAERESELSGLKNQEVTIENLRDQLVEAQRNRAEAVQQTAKNTSSEWEAILRGYQDREATASHTIANAQQEAVKWRLMHQGVSEQLSTLRIRLDDIEAQREREIASLVEELDEASTQLALRDREVRRLTELIPSVNVSVNESQPLEHVTPTPQRASARAANLMLEEHVHELMREVDDLKTQLSQQEAQYRSERSAMLANQQAELARQTEVSQAALDAITEQLDGARNEILSQKTFSRGLQDELQRSQTSLRLVEAELMNKERQTITTAAKRSETSELVPISDFSAAPQPPLAEVAPQPAEEDTFVAMAGQRDRLRQRLLALEEASSQEIHRLQLEVQELRMEQCNTHSVSVLATHPQDDSEVARKPLMMFQQGRINLTSEAIVEFLDRGNMLLGRMVLSNVHWRRGFVGYLLLLHIYLVLSTVLTILFG